MKNLLVVDDEVSIGWGLRRLGESLGWQVVTVSSAEQALQEPTMAPDVIVLDIRLPGMDGLTALAHLQRRWPHAAIIVVTAHGNLETAVSAVGQGAFEYLVKPFDLPTMEQTLLRAANPTDPPSTAVSEIEPPSGMIGRSPSMQRVFKQIALAANSDANVLLQGESGTGKELAARAIHQYSARSAHPFVAVNVAALNPQLAESELFGHVRGAFTGADYERTGLLAQANEGTLFLDEIADIPLSSQVKLLRSLEHGEVLPVGGNQPFHTHCRVISATHQNLAERVDAGQFRHDLYFRLNTFTVELPPLRQRCEDIPLLARHFIGSMRPAEACGGPPVLSDEAIAELQRRPWYGNVRELRNAIEHALIVARGGTILPEHFPVPATTPALAAPSTAESLEDRIAALIATWTDRALLNAPEVDAIYERLLQMIEPAAFRVAIGRHQGQCASAARQLGLHRTTLRKKLDQYHIDTTDM